MHDLQRMSRSFSRSSAMCDVSLASISCGIGDEAYVHQKKYAICNQEHGKVGKGGKKKKNKREIAVSLNRTGAGSATTNSPNH